MRLAVVGVFAAVVLVLVASQQTLLATDGLLEREMPLSAHLALLAAVAWCVWRLVCATANAHALAGRNSRSLGNLLLASLPFALFTALAFYAWETLVTVLAVPLVILPAPSGIAMAFTANIRLLGADFMQTYVFSVIPGYFAGCAAAFVFALGAWRYATLRYALLPLGSFMSVMPIVGVAPIMVMWFGFDWQSKAAVAMLLTFFPMLVSFTAGFASPGRMDRDLMRTYAADRWTVFARLALPSSLPHVFNGLKVCSTLALIGAIVAEFFGTPIVGMGFRISSEIGRMGLDMVWATIVVSALAGTGSYGALVLLERTCIFWHASQRQDGRRGA